MIIRTPLRRFSFCLLGLLLAVSTATACPDCLLKNSGGIIEPQTTMAKLAFSASTIALILFSFFIIGVLVFSMIKACKDLEKERPLSSVEGV